LSNSKGRFGPILYDFRRGIRSKLVIIMVVLLIASSFAVASNDSSVNRQQFTSSYHVSTAVYLNNAGYHFLSYSSNVFGDPIAGTFMQFNLTDPQNKIYSTSGRTNSTGYSLLTISAPVSDSYTLTTPGSCIPVNSCTQELPMRDPTTGQNLSLNGRAVVSNMVVEVADSANTSNSLLQIFYAGPNGSTPDNYGVYYKMPNQSFSHNSVFGAVPLNETLNQSQMQRIGTLDSYHQTLDFSIPPNLNNSSSNFDSVLIGIFAKNGSVLQEVSTPAFMFNSNTYIEGPVDLATQFFAGTFGLLVPLMVILGSYSSYGRDRVSGVLESILSKPVTRRGLALSRYLSTILAMSFATLVAVASVDLILGYYFSGAYLDPEFLLATFGALFVEIAAFAGLTFLFAHLVRSSGLLIGLSIGLLLLFEFFWSLIAYVLMVVANTPSGSTAALHLEIGSYFFSPTEFTTLVYTSLTHKFLTNPVSPASLGIDPASLIVTGILWVTLPLFAYLRLATKRD